MNRFLGLFLTIFTLAACSSDPVEVSCDAGVGGAGGAEQVCTADANDIACLSAQKTQENCPSCVGLQVGDQIPQNCLDCSVVSDCLVVCD